MRQVEVPAELRCEYPERAAISGGMARPHPGELGHLRVLVTARPGRHKKFIWQLVRDAAGGRLLVDSASTVTFHTMDEAHTAGIAALNKQKRP